MLIRLSNTTKNDPRTDSLGQRMSSNGVREILWFVHLSNTLINFPEQERPGQSTSKDDVCGTLNFSYLLIHYLA